ncbi:Ff.00g061990.m01.CDS01 [Fusarium sp. VM40]|nr:Ff.00g061990.m01.CDS01 [Fusarium sp. VM40]
MCCIGLGYCRSITVWILAYVACESWEYHDRRKERKEQRLKEKQGVQSTPEPQY